MRRLAQSCRATRLLDFTGANLNCVGNRSSKSASAASFLSSPKEAPGISTAQNKSASAACFLSSPREAPTPRLIYCIEHVFFYHRYGQEELLKLGSVTKKKSHHFYFLYMCTASIETHQLGDRYCLPFLYVGK